jgi:hypothetical protein
MNQRRLRQIESEIDGIKKEIAELAILRPGTLTRQYKDPRNKRGPYYQVSYTHQTRSRTQYVRKASVAQVRREIRDYERLKGLIERWVSLGIEHSSLSQKQADG